MDSKPHAESNWYLYRFSCHV